MAQDRETRWWVRDRVWREAADRLWAYTWLYRERILADNCTGTPCNPQLPKIVQRGASWSCEGIFISVAADCARSEVRSGPGTVNVETLSDSYQSHLQPSNHAKSPVDTPKALECQRMPTRTLRPCVPCVKVSPSRPFFPVVHRIAS